MEEIRWGDSYRTLQERYQPRAMARETPGNFKFQPKLQEAWLNRGENPRPLQRILTQYAKDLRAQYAKVPDVALTEDRNLVTAMVKRASAPRSPSHRRTMAGWITPSSVQRCGSLESIPTSKFNQPNLRLCEEISARWIRAGDGMIVRVEEYRQQPIGVSWDNQDC
jgi:hypothetical protein